jgi:uncharacterized protein (DUF1697 family)
MRRREVWIALFRGVGGKTQLPVAPLRAALAADGFEDVSTYINSGNAVMRGPRDRDEVMRRIAAVCRREFAFDKDVYCRTVDEWRRLIAANPFADRVDVPPSFIHAAVLGATPEAAAVDALRALASGNDRIGIVGDVAYLLTPDGFGTSKLAARFDKGIGVPNTARNWNTVQALLSLAERIETSA